MKKRERSLKVSAFLFQYAAFLRSSLYFFEACFLIDRQCIGVIQCAGIELYMMRLVAPGLLYHSLQEIITRILCQ